MSNLEVDVNTLKVAYLKKNLTKGMAIEKKPKLILDLLISINPETDHSKEKFLYVGYDGEHLSMFNNLPSFWLSPRKIMESEEYGSCSSRNKEILGLWIFLFGWNKEIQVSHCIRSCVQYHDSSGWLKIASDYL